MSSRNSQERTKREFIDLNNDCLMHICSFLSPIERLRLACASEIFNVAVCHYIQHYELQMDDLAQNFTLFEVEELLRRFGEYIRRIGPWSDPLDENLCNEYFHLLYMYCHNIEEIGIYYPWNPDFSTYKRIFESSARTLSKVAVYQKISAQLDENLNELFENARNLKCLELLDNDISGRYLSNLKNLTELSLECCESINPIYFIEFCRVVRLRKLNIAGCRLLNDEAFQVLCETQTYLEDLVISNNYEGNTFEIVGKLKSLRKLEICECTKRLDKLLRLLHELMLHHSEDLQALDIASNFCYETEAAQDILSKISKFRNLKKLTLPNLNFISNNECLRHFTENCHRLEDLRIIVFTNYQWLTNDAILQLMKLRCLRKLQIGPIFPLDVNLMASIYVILKMKNTVQLNIYLDEGCVDDELLDMMETTTYKDNEKMLKIHVQSVEDDDDV